MIFSPVVFVLSLTLGDPVTGSLAAGEKSVHTITVPPQTAARVHVIQDGINVVARLRAPGSSDTTDASDMSFGVRGDEVLIVPVGDVETTWEVSIEPALPGAARGSYTAALQLGPRTADFVELPSRRHDVRGDARS